MRNKKGQFEKNHKLAKGRPKLTPEMRAIRNLTNEQFISISKMLMESSIADLKRVAADHVGESALVAYIAQVIVKAHSRGDWNTLDSILGRLIGKTPDNLNVNTNHNIHSYIKDYINGEEES
jgi:hypothetical protein